MEVTKKNYLKNNKTAALVLENGEILLGYGLGVKKAVVGERFGSFDLGFDDFGSNDLALDYNFESGDKSAARINMHVDNFSDHF